MDRVEGDGVHLGEQEREESFHPSEFVSVNRKRDGRNKYLKLKSCGSWFHKNGDIKNEYKCINYVYFNKNMFFQTSYSINVLWGGVVSSVGPVALKGEVVFGSRKGDLKCKVFIT